MAGAGNDGLRAARATTSCARRRERPTTRRGRRRRLPGRHRGRFFPCPAERPSWGYDSPHARAERRPAPRRAEGRRELGHLPLDFRAMWAVRNLFRVSAAIRRHMEAKVLSADRLSWTSFVAIWVLWVKGEMESRDLAAAIGVSRPTSTGVVTTSRAAATFGAQRRRRTVGWCASNSPRRAAARSSGCSPRSTRGGGRDYFAPRAAGGGAARGLVALDAPHGGRRRRPGFDAR